jgi:hypothetical protein
VAYFEEQNEKINSMPLKKNGAIPIHFDTIGLISGCTDMLTQASFYPEMAFNNTYGIQAITLDEYEASKLAYSQPGGCASLTETCRALATEFDPDNHGNVPLVNEACISADSYCGNFVIGPYLTTTVCAFPPRTEMSPCIWRTTLTGRFLQRDAFDMAQFPTTTFPPPFVVGFFNQHWVQAALGAPVNFTVASNGVTNGRCHPEFSLARWQIQYTRLSERLTAIAAFASTGDYLISRGGTMDQYTRAIESGVRIAMMYGDRDYTCGCKLIDSNSKIISSMLILIDYNRAWWGECHFEYQASRATPVSVCGIRENPNE